MKYRCYISQNKGTRWCVPIRSKTCSTMISTIKPFQLVANSSRRVTVMSGKLVLIKHQTELTTHYQAKYFKRITRAKWWDYNESNVIISLILSFWMPFHSSVSVICLIVVQLIIWSRVIEGWVSSATKCLQHLE